MTNISAVFKKQVLDTLKNKAILIQFILFPLMTVIMTTTGVPPRFFTNMFAPMYMGMAPLISMATIISEEKEKNTLRALLRANVKPMEYLAGVGGYVLLGCMTGSVILGAPAGFSPREWCAFALIMLCGISVSLVMGAAIGTLSKSMSSGVSMAMPVMMIFSFLPMLAQFNDTVAKIARITYTQQFTKLLGSVENINISAENVCVILLNALAATAAFVVAYKKCGLE